ncbi:MAG: gluconate 2-dehydrogenase subunit 3 family protein [Opitutales bacterium]|nr:gluconate 2-dehydrogenase subunit 3 family protein [Opitutales bacterium]
MATRRTFIKTSLAVSAGVALYGCNPSEASEQPFTKSERDCLIAMAEQFIPADEEWGGATEAGVINYIENWVTKYHPTSLPIFKNGVESMQKSAQRLYSKNFQELDFNTQTNFLKQMEKGKLSREDWTKINQQYFFEEMLTRSMQGFYGPPRHGGNKNYMSYRMCGIDMPHVLGQNRYGGNA